METDNKKKVAAFAVAVALAIPAWAGIELGTPFADHVVLQRGMKVPVWGKVTPEMNTVPPMVTVSFAGQEKSATADPVTGAWKVELDPMEASKESRTMTVTLESGHWLTRLFGRGESVEVKDVLVGEVWFASGQSNMDCPIWSGGHTRYRDGKGSMMCAMANMPLVRFFKCPHAWSVEPRAIKACWRPMTAENVSQQYFSAVAFYYARELYLALGIPVGIVDASWGGTNIDAWTPRCGYEGCDPSIRAVADLPVKNAKDWKKKDKPEPDDPERVIGAAHQQPTVLFNGMVEAWCPMAMRGFIWYQGCHNNGQAKTYCAKMHALYNGWARAFENPRLKLYFAELAPYGSNWNALVGQQMQFAAEEENAAISVLADVGNVHDIHPNDKETVAQRLALHALRRDYGFAIAEDDSPTYRSHSVGTNGVVTVAFDHAKEFYVYAADCSKDAPFELAGTNGVWEAAQIVNFRPKPKDRWADTYRIDDSAILLKSDKVAEPVRVRYMGRDRTTGTVYNEMTLPLGPFETK